MKKIFTILVAIVATLSVNAWEYENPGFEWSVGADFTSSYLWRGMRCGGAAIQPDVTIGYGGLNLDVWANISPLDNTFQEFAPEVDFTLSYTIAGLTIGATHQYYCDGTKFFDGKMPTLIDYTNEEYSSNQTEVFAKFAFGDIFEKIPLTIMWSTYVSGDDWKEIYNDADELTGLERAYSSYLEVSYDAELPLGFTLTPTVGMTPWASVYNNYEDQFSVNNISLKLNWCLEVGDHFELDLYAIGMLNTAGITKENIIPSLSGNDQRLNGAIGVGLWLF